MMCIMTLRKFLYFVEPNVISDGPTNWFTFHFRKTDIFLIMDFKQLAYRCELINLLSNLFKTDGQNGHFYQGWDALVTIGTL